MDGFLVDKKPQRSPNSDTCVRTSVNSSKICASSNSRIFGSSAFINGGITVFLTIPGLFFPTFFAFLSFTAPLSRKIYLSVKMKFTTIFAVLAAAAATVGAAPAETNGDRLARGLPPLPPARRATHVGCKLVVSSPKQWLTEHPPFSCTKE